MMAMAELSLIPIGPDLMHAFARSRDALGLGLLDGRPRFPEALDPPGPDLAPPWAATCSCLPTRW
jgi:hypothetical protein